MSARAEFLAQLGLSESDVSDTKCGSGVPGRSNLPSGGGGWDKIMGSDCGTTADCGVAAAAAPPPTGAVHSSSRAAFLSEMGITDTDAEPPPGVTPTRRPSEVPAMRTDSAASRRAEFMAEMGITPSDMATGEPSGANGIAHTPKYGRRSPDMGMDTPSPRQPPAYGAQSATSSFRSARDRDATAYQRNLEKEAGFDYGVCDSPPAAAMPRAGRRSEPPLSDEIQARIDSLPQDPSAMQLKEVGNACFQAKNFTAASKYYTMGLERSPDDFVLLSNRSAAYLQGPMISGPAMALRDAERCVDLYPDRFKGWSRKGDALFKKRKYEDAVECYRQSLELNPDNQVARTSLKQCQELLGWTESSKLPNALEKDFQEKFLNKPFTTSPASTSSAYSVPRATGGEISEAAEVGRNYREAELEKFRRERPGYSSSTSGRNYHRGTESVAGSSPGSGGPPRYGTDTMGSGGGGNSPDYEYASTQGTTSATSSAAATFGEYSTTAAKAYREQLMSSFRKRKEDGTACKDPLKDTGGPKGSFQGYQGTDYRRVNKEVGADPAMATDMVGKAISADARQSTTYSARNW